MHEPLREYLGLWVLHTGCMTALDALPCTPVPRKGRHVAVHSAEAFRETASHMMYLCRSRTKREAPGRCCHWCVERALTWVLPLSRSYSSTSYGISCLPQCKVSQLGAVGLGALREHPEPLLCLCGSCARWPGMAEMLAP